MVMAETDDQDMAEPQRPGATGNLRAYLWTNSRFYLGLRAPCMRQRSPDCWLRAARGRAPETVRAAIAQYCHGADGVERVNFRCARVRLTGSAEALFVKEFPQVHRLHKVERWVRCSRVDRAWRAGHLLPLLGILTPRPVGTAYATAADGVATEYLVTEWLESAASFPDVLRNAGPPARAALLGEFAGRMRGWHSLGLYVRDLVKNVLVTNENGARQYWLTDLDGLHPIRWPNRDRMLFHLRQLAHWARPLTREEAEMIAGSYLAGAGGQSEGSLSAIVATLLAD